MPSKVGITEYGNRGVIFYAGVVEEAPPPPEVKVVEKIVYKPIPVKKEVHANRYIFPTIVFEHGSAELGARAVTFDEKSAEITSPAIQLEYAARMIKDSGSDKVFVEGHIDALEKDQYPDLGMKRAEAVKEALVDAGVKADILVLKDFGATRPLGVVDAEFAHRINRRVTFTIVPRGESLEPEKLEQPPAPQPGPNIKIVEKIVEKEITVPELVVTDRVIFPNIYFEYDKATLTPEGLDNTKRAATLVKNMDRLRKVTVEGHCDWRGTDAYNDALSMRRANTVKNKMIELGVDAAILDAVGYGERHPIASNETSLGMALNRRVEFKIEYR
jgi:outer membrane protein OmpA-like peptidoglycan-associated protein